MVSKLFKFLVYLLFFLGALMFFIPKVSLYYFAETQVKPFGVIISNEKVIDKGFSLQIENGSLSMKKIPGADIASIDIMILGLYNTIDVRDIKLSDAVKSFAPTNISNIKLHYSIFNPLYISAEAHGEFGVARATIDIAERKVHVDLEASKIMKKNYKSTLRNLKKTKSGVYVYDKNI